MTGPRALIPPPALDDFGWLEPELRLIHWKAPGYKKESVTLFTDNTVNRDDHFLQPIIRLAFWERGRDIQTRPHWPSITIQFGYFSDDDHQLLHNTIYQFHQTLSSTPFLAFGISANREVPDFPHNDRGELEIFASNGVQSVEITTPALPNGDELTDQFFFLFAQLKAACRPFDHKDWRERYNYNLRDVTPFQAWDWDGSIPQAVL